MESPKKANNKPSKPNRPEDKSFMKYYALAFELVALNLVLILGGYYLDKALSVSPAFILTATFLSTAGTIWLLVRSLK